MLEDGQYHPVSGTATIAAGEDLNFRTISHNGMIRITPSAVGTIFNMIENPNYGI